jgi:ribosomal protein S21
MKPPTPYEEITPKFSPLEIAVEGDGEMGFAYAFKKFRMAVQRSRVLSDYKAAQSYEKPSDKKRRKRREAIERARLMAIIDKQMQTGEWDKIKARKEEKREQKRLRNLARDEERKQAELEYGG